MSSDLLDDWDETFLEQAIQLELDATASRNSTATPAAAATSSFVQSGQVILPPRNPISEPPPSGHTTFSREPSWVRLGKEQPFPSRSLSSYGLDGDLADYGIGFSPPKELSQRIPGKPEPSRAVDDCEIIEAEAFRSSCYGVLSASGGGGGGYAGQRGVGKDKEIERLKRELGHVSKQLSHLETEYQELQKDRAKKDTQLKSAFLQIEAKDAEITSLKTATLEVSRQEYSFQVHDLNTSTEQAHHAYLLSEDKYIWIKEQADRSTVPTSDCKAKRSIGSTAEQTLNSQNFESYGTKRKEARADGCPTVSELKRQVMIDNCEGGTTTNGCSKKEGPFLQKTAQKSFSKAVGVQAELDADCQNTFGKDKHALQHDASSKLLTVWGSINTSSGTNLVSKLFSTCSEDFYVLFTCMDKPDDINLNSLKDGSAFDASSEFHAHSSQSVDAATVSRLYAMLIKISKEMAEMDSLLEVLVDLCMLNNVLIVDRSLRILKAILQILLTHEVKSYRRDQIVLTQYNHNVLEENDNDKSKGKLLGLSEYNDDSNSSTCISMDHRISLIETMQKIAVRNTDEHIRVGTLSIMNLIVMGSEPSSEREKFGLILLNESFPKFLHKEVGVAVQKQALQLLFLLLNCPKILMMFCGQNDNSLELSHGQNDRPQLDLSSVILEGLAECITCGGKNILELKLQRKAVIVLAFIASLGKSGFEILLKSVPPLGANFIEMIIQLLASKMDAESDGSDKSQDLFKESIVLMREALILLNRLVSNSSYSKVALGVLTRSSTSASSTIDVANKMSRRSRECWRYDCVKKIQTMEAETIDLARSFRARVLSFLGENVS